MQLDFDLLRHSLSAASHAPRLSICPGDFGVNCPADFGKKNVSKLVTNTDRITSLMSRFNVLISFLHATGYHWLIDFREKDERFK